MDKAKNYDNTTVNFCPSITDGREAKNLFSRDLIFTNIKVSRDFKFCLYYENTFSQFLNLVEFAETNSEYPFYQLWNLRKIGT